MKIVQQNRATLKLFFVGVLSLAMLIPLLMIRSVIDERQEMQQSAADAIAARWGGSQSIGGLVALQPCDNQDRKEWCARTPAKLEVTATLLTETRYLGIYEFPVYSTELVLQGEFEPVDWQGSDRDLRLWMPLSDVRGVREISPLKIGGLEIEARPMDVHSTELGGLQFRPGREQLAQWVGRDRIPYRLELKLAGSEALMFLPLAERTQVMLQSDWPHPEFVGQYLPFERQVARAAWRLLGLNRPYGDSWKVAEMPLARLAQSGFGMRLEMPVDAYQRSERSVKYGFLFISLTFFTLFLFEVMTGRPLHPVPYILTGAALAVFYLVLLALSEYLPFGWAFAIAAVLLVGIVTPYTSAVLGGRRRGFLVGFMLSLTYLLLYVLVTAQHASLLLGALSLLLAIGTLMYLTRGVDWYSYGRSGVY
jgi:inner membrane protein